MTATANHYVEDDALKRVIARALRDSGRRRLNAEMRAAEVLKQVDAFLARQPLAPDVVGVAGAAEMIGVPKPRIARLREAGRIPEPLYDLPSGPLWLREEIAEVAASYRRGGRAPAGVAG